MKFIPWNITHRKIEKRYLQTWGRINQLGTLYICKELKPLRYHFFNSPVLQKKQDDFKLSPGQ